MRNILLAFLMTALPVSIAAAEPLAAQKPARTSTSKTSTPITATSDQPLPLKRSGDVNTCAAFGPGFVKVNGSDTCVKVGGAMSVGVSGGR